MSGARSSMGRLFQSPDTRPLDNEATVAVFRPRSRKGLICEERRWRRPVHVSVVLLTYVLLFLAVQFSLTNLLDTIEDANCC